MEGKDLLGMALKFGGMALNAYKDYNNNQDKQQPQGVPPEGLTRLQGQLKFCSYPAQAVDAVTKAGSEALRVYPDLTSEVLSYYENGVKKTFIELKGKIPVEYKGSTYGVNMSMMLPEGFPMQPPFIRVINQSPDKYIVEPVYEAMKSSNDPNSYILTNLMSLTNWNGRYQAVVDVIQEAMAMMSHTFPFKRKKNPEINQDAYGSNPYPGGNAGFNFPSQSSQGGFPSQGFPPQEGYQPSGFMQQGYGPQPGFIPQPGFNSNPNQGYYGQPNMGFPQNGGFGNDYGGNQNVGFLNPVQAKGKESGNSAKAQLDQYLTLSKTFIDGTRLTVDRLNAGHQSVWTMSKELSIVNNIVASQNTRLQEKAALLSNLIRKSEESPDIDYKSLVVAQDAYSAQLLDLVSENKAWTEASAWLESEFSSDKLPLDVFLKLSRRIEEERFQSSYLIKKCIKERGR